MLKGILRYWNLGISGTLKLGNFEMKKRRNEDMKKRRNEEINK